MKQIKKPDYLKYLFIQRYPVHLQNFIAIFCFQFTPVANSFHEYSRTIFDCIEFVVLTFSHYFQLLRVVHFQRDSS